MRNYGILSSFVLGFAFGILFASFELVSQSFLIIFSIIASSMLAFSFAKKKRQYVLLVIVFCFSFFCGVVRLSLWVHPENEHLLREYVDERITLVGMVSENPEERATNTKLVLTIDEAVVREGVLAPSRTERTVIFTDLYVPYKYGDTLEVTGKIVRPENFETESGRTFDYVRYLEKDRIYYQMSFVDIEILSQDGGSKIMKGLFKLKNSFVSRMEKTIKEPEQSLASGILFGDRGFSKRLQDSFIATGTIHIVALSGYNITIVSNYFFKILAFLPFFPRLWGSLLSIVLFVLMTGGQATAVRAGLMASLVILSRILGRTSDITRVILLACFLMVFHNPYILAFDVSFQLSFIATIGIIYFTPVVEKWFIKFPERFGIREIVSTTFATQIFVLPFLLYVMGIFSITSFPANLLVLPVIPYAMGLSFLTGLLGFVSPIIATPFGFLTYILLGYVIWVIEIFAKIPYGFFYIEQFPFIIVVLIYGFLGWVIWKKNMTLQKDIDVI